MMSKASVSAGVYKYRTEKLRIQDFVTALFFCCMLSHCPETSDYVNGMNDYSGFRVSRTRSF